MGEKQVVLWVPTSQKRPESWSCVDAYLQMNVPEGYQMIWKRSPTGNVRVIWNQVVKDFLDMSDAEYLWSVHDDVLIHTDALERLLSWEKPLVSALVFHRHSPVLPHIWKPVDGGGYSQRIQETKRWFLDRPEHIKFGPYVINPRPDDALVETGFTSTSCTLMHRSVLEALREPMKEEWFVMDSEYGGGEDRNFFEHAREAGFVNYVDRSCIAGHIVGDVPTGAADFLMWEAVSVFKGTCEEDEAVARLRAEIPVR